MLGPVNIVNLDDCDLKATKCDHRALYVRGKEMYSVHAQQCMLCGLNASSNVLAFQTLRHGDAFVCLTHGVLNRLEVVTKRQTDVSCSLGDISIGQSASGSASEFIYLPKTMAQSHVESIIQNLIDYTLKLHGDEE